MKPIQWFSPMLALCLLFVFCATKDSRNIDVTEGWRFAPDPDNIGLQRGWHLIDFDDTAWAEIRGGTRWEDQGFVAVDGYAWYRKTLHIPANMRAERIWLNLGGLNDCGIVYCNGKQVGEFGDQTRLSVAASPIAADLTDGIRWGHENVIAIRVFDWGDSGGLQRVPCSITTDLDALAVQSMLCFVPGFDGRPSLVGLEVGPMGVGEGNPLRFSLTIKNQKPLVQETVSGLTHEGRPAGVARFDHAGKPGDVILVKAEILHGDGSAGMRFEQTYTYPEPPKWQGKYRHLKVLNNFVTELLSIARVDSQCRRYSFLNPRNGWIFLRVAGAKAAVAHLDARESSLIWRKHPDTGALEAMQQLDAGEHSVRIDGAQGAHFEIRAVPEIAFCYWPTYSTVKPLPPRDWTFGEVHIFPNVNVLLTHDDMTEDFFEQWRAEGRKWISNAGLPGLHDDTAPTADFVYEKWAANPCVSRPGYSGMIVDEFLSNPPDYYAAWSAALDRFYHIPAFNGQVFYAWIGDNFSHKPAVQFMRQLYDLGGRFAWEKYLHEEPTEDMALMRAYFALKPIEEWNRLIPGIKERITICLGAFTLPTCSININPGTNYLPFMDSQYHILATDPMFFGLLGAFEYSAHYMDDDVLRYALKLYRHYCIDGKRTPFADFPYELAHIRNPDFAEGLAGWQVEAAETGSVAPGGLRGLGRLQARWASLGTGDQCAVMVRSSAVPNKISQIIRNLQPGRLYTMKYIVADLGNLYAEKAVGLYPTIQEAEVVEQGSFREVKPSAFAATYEDEVAVKLEGMAYTTYCQLAFRPKSTTAELSFSDWKNGAPAGPVGQRIGFNFVEIQPFYE